MKRQKERGILLCEAEMMGSRAEGRYRAECGELARWEAWNDHSVNGPKMIPVCNAHRRFYVKRGWRLVAMNGHEPE